MKNKSSISSSGSQRESSHDGVTNIRTNPPHIYDNITRRLLQFGLTMGITTFIGLIVRYAVQEFDPSVSTITVTTSRVNDSDVASLSVSKHFLERLFEFIEESIAIVATVIPIGFPICTIFNRYSAKMRAKRDKIVIKNDKVLAMIPKYVVIGDIQACQLPNLDRHRPLVRDTIYQLIKSHLKPKLIVEESYEDARRLGIRIGLLRKDHHRLAIIKSVDLLKTITDSRGDIKQGKVRYLLSRMKIMSQSTPADKSLLIYLMKHCESMPNENLAYLGYSFTDPEAMRVADCSITFQDCDDEDVKKNAQVIFESDNMTFTDLYLFIIICLLTSNITQSYALYQLSFSISSCIYRFLSITVFQEQLISHSQYSLIIMIQQVFAILALMTKWLVSLPQMPLKTPIAEMSHAVTEDTLIGAGAGADTGGDGGSTGLGTGTGNGSADSSSIPAISTSISHGKNSPRKNRHHHRSLSGNGYGDRGETAIKMHRLDQHQHHHHEADEAAAYSTTLDSSADNSDSSDAEDSDRINGAGLRKSRSDLNNATPTTHSSGRRSSRLRHRSKHRTGESSQHIHLSGVDLDQAVINSNLVTSYKQTFHNSRLIDDVTYRLAKLHVAYQVLVMIIIMIFGNAMFQLSTTNNRQHQTLALNSLIMNNIFNLANCFNQFGEFNVKSGFRNHPFFVCALLLAIFVQVSLTELNAFGLENLNPIQWFVCFVFALLSALIAPLTGQQQRQRVQKYQQEQNERQMRARTRIKPHQKQHSHTHHRTHKGSPSKAAGRLTGGSGGGGGGNTSKHDNPYQGRKSQVSSTDE